MKFVAFGVIAAALISATPALAQSPAAAGSAMCVYDSTSVLRRSTAGQSFGARMQALQQEVQQELNPYVADLQQRQTAVEQALGQLNGGQPSAELQQQAAEGQRRVEEFNNLRAQRQRELAYTEEQQLEAIGTAVGPLINAAFQQSGCGILFARGAVLIPGSAVDISENVLAQLNRTLPSVTFNRMPVPAQQQQ